MGASKILIKLSLGDQESPACTLILESGKAGAGPADWSDAVALKTV